jgi:hypothetical protein
MAVTPVTALPKRSLIEEGPLSGETAVWTVPYPAPSIVPELLPKMVGEETAVQTRPEPVPQEVAAVERMVEDERPLVQTMPLDAVMQPFLDNIQPPAGEQEVVSSVLPEADHEAEEAAGPEADAEGVIEELAQHVYRQLRQRLATDWERRRTR